LKGWFHAIESLKGIIMRVNPVEYISRPVLLWELGGSIGGSLDGSLGRGKSLLK